MAGILRWDEDDITDIVMIQDDSRWMAMLLSASIETWCLECFFDEGIAESLHAVAESYSTPRSGSPVVKWGNPTSTAHLEHVTSWLEYIPS